MTRHPSIHVLGDPAPTRPDALSSAPDMSRREAYAALLDAHWAAEAQRLEQQHPRPRFAWLRGVWQGGRG